MLNPYTPQIAVVKKIKQQTPDTKLFTFQLQDKSKINFQHGQFMQAGVFGYGEAPFTICSSTKNKKTFDLAIREMGDLTEKFHQLKVGDKVTMRGPFGNGFPIENFKDKNILLIGGGCGFVTMRSFLLDYLAGNFNPKNKMQVFYGCLNEENLLFTDEQKKWQKKVDYQIALMKPSKKWQGTTGVVTKIFEKVKVVQDAVAIIVGPPVMYKFVLEELKKHGFSDADIYFSLERRMYCGVGVCQHCAVGPYYVCKNGPVFSYEQLKDVKGAI